jgi:hypothetical protein
VVRSYDLAGLIPRFEHRPVTVDLLPYAPTHFEVQLPEKEGEAIDPNVIADVLMNLLGPEFQYEGRGVHIEERNRLVIAAPKDVQDKVQRILATFEQAFSGTFEIVVDVLSLKPDVDVGRLVPSTVLGAAEAERLLGELKSSSTQAGSYRLRLHPGRASAIDATRQIVFVRDYDMEIAQAAGCADPIVDSARVGTQIVLRGVPALDGVALALFVRRAEPLGEVHTREFPISGAVVSERGLDLHEVARYLQSPDIQFRALVLNTFLRDGQALVAATSYDLQKARGQELIMVRLAGERPAAVQTLRVDASGADGGGSAHELTLVDAGLFQAPAWRLAEPLTNGNAVLSYDSSLTGSNGFFNVWLNETTGEQGAEALQQVQPEPSFTSAWPLHVNVRQLATAENIPSLKGAVLEIAPRHVVRSVTLTLKRIGARGTPVRIGVPVRAGEASAGIVGVEQMVVSDYDVEVANNSSVANPVTQAIVDGVGYWLRPIIAPSGDLSLELKVRANLRADDGREAETRTLLYEKLDLPTFDTLWIDEQLVFRGGVKEMVLGDSAVSLVVQID